MGDVHNRRGSLAQRKALRSQGTSSEATLWSALKGRGLDGWKFRRQHSIGPFIVDLYCPEARLVIEIDGLVHANPTASINDQERERYFATMGLRTLRIENAAVVNDIEGVLDLIRSRLSSHN